MQTSDCASCTADCSSAGGNSGTIPRVPNPTIKLTLEDDTVLECAVLTTFPVEGFGEYIALVPLNQNGKSPEGETYLFRFSEEGDNPVVTNIEREDEYMAAAEAFHDFNRQSEKRKRAGGKLISLLSKRDCVRQPLFFCFFIIHQVLGRISPRLSGWDVYLNIGIFCIVVIIKWKPNI